MNHQKVTAVLRNAGFGFQALSPGRFIAGIQVAQVDPATVGVLCGTRYTVAEVKAELEAAGLTVTTRPNTATDALFVTENGELKMKATPIVCGKLYSVEFQGMRVAVPAPNAAAALAIFTGAL